MHPAIGERFSGLVLFFPLFLFGCGAGSGTLSMLTYNVAGLPQGISDSQPHIYSAQISPLLNNYEIVLVQEDFVYHKDLMSQVEHPYQTEEKVPESKLMNDGLNRFSNYLFTGFERQMWQECSGGISDCSSDCLAEKGFSFARMELAPGVSVDVYNHHADAGSCEADLVARESQFNQLAAYIAKVSGGRAVIVGGDNNLTGFADDDEPRLQSFLTATGMQDACRFISCGEEHIDRFLFRGSDELEVLPSAWSVERNFVDSDGNDLSDHPAIHVNFSWSRL